MSSRRVNLGRDTSGRPCIVDAPTLRALDEAGRRLGHPLTIVQGCYVEPGTGAAASALTHAGGGVVDLRVWDLPGLGIKPEDALWVLRRWCGFAAWLRTREQGFDPHFHAVRIDATDLHPQAARQVEDYRAGKDGLAYHRPDPTPRPKVIRGWRELRAIARRRAFLVAHPQFAARAENPTARRRFLARHRAIARAWYALGGAR